jgi:hypothetical protein
MCALNKDEEPYNPHLFDIIFVGSKFLKHPVHVCVTHVHIFYFLSRPLKHRSAVPKKEKQPLFDEIIT